MDRRDSAL
jgi:hypothetical protein